jgi:hypothetical protein
MTDFARAELRYERAMRRLMGVVGLVLAAVVVASGVTLWTILDCTRPGWSCYERGQKQGGEFMRQLINDNRQLHGAPTIPPKEQQP